MADISTDIREKLSALAKQIKAEEGTVGLSSDEQKLQEALAPFVVRAFTVTYTIVTTRTLTQEVEAETEQDAKDSVLNEEFVCHDEGEEQDEDVDVAVVDVEEQG